jgi:ABC-type sugar transport system permease subunit
MRGTNSLRHAAGHPAGLTISILMSMIVELAPYDIVKVITDGGPGYATETIAYNIITQAFGMNGWAIPRRSRWLLFVLIGLLSF